MSQETTANDVSLNELTEAFAMFSGEAQEMPLQERDELCREVNAEAEEHHTGSQVRLYDPALVAAGTVPEEETAEFRSAFGGDQCEVSPQTVFEAMLFVGDKENAPLTPEQAASLMRGVSTDEIPGIAAELEKNYRQRGCPYQIAFENGGYLMKLHPNFDKLRERFYGKVRETRLSQAAIDVLAIVAYQQPISADEITEMRGSPVGGILSQMVRRNLLAMSRDEDKNAIYSTTERFLEIFQLSSLDDLPMSEEME